MEKMGDLVGSRQSDLNKSFKLAIRSLLTTSQNKNSAKHSITLLLLSKWVPSLNTYSDLFLILLNFVLVNV
ncbi:hypothetical protein Pint_19445 [Pistacia integerrima]|uniref:Uncharacterized protein n=1 Tax=Pistacia integerrima TaxID=434235 RepID=A0ACC0YZC5_9ROSI|nr:hypothetical protein Pint_19445 [Pistacia integerrima]